MRLRTFGIVLLAYARVANALPLELSELSKVEDVEDLSLGELLDRPVIAASRYVQDPSSSPSLVSSVDAELIDRFGYRTLGDALRGVRGVYTSNDRNYGYIGVRGLSEPGDYNTRLALSIDGHGINDPVYAQGASGAELGMPMIAIDHIEVLRGGAWSLYGASALLGAIEIVSASGATRPGLRASSTTRVGVETTADPAGRPTFAPRGEDISASYGAVSHGVDVFVAASYLFDPGLSSIYSPEFADPSLVCVDHAASPRPCDGLVHGNDGERAASAYAVLRSRGLAMHALVSFRRKQVATAPFDALIDDPGTQTDDNRIYADAEYAASGPRGDLIARISGDYYGYYGHYAYDHPSPGAEMLPASRALVSDQAPSIWYKAELRGRYKIARLGRYLSDLEVATGGELGVSFATQRYFYPHPEGNEVFLDRTDRNRVAAITAQVSVRAAEHVVGFAAIRGDYYPDAFGLAVNPQGGVVLDGGERGRVRASIARGFRAPNAYERYFGSDIQSVNPELRPERSETRELSVERYLGKYVRGQLIFYTQHITDIITRTVAASGDFQIVNHDVVHSRGVEAELEARWHDIRVRTSYAWQTSADGDGQRLVNSPGALAYGSLLVPIVRGRLDAAIETSYLGARPSGHDNPVPASFLTNVSVTARNVVDQLDVTLGASNLFDARTGDPGGSEDHRQSLIPHDPRVVWLRLQLDLGR